jgi:proline-specific peptidase
MNGKERSIKVSTKDIRVQEGYITVGEYQVWYRSVGGGAKQENVPLLLLHGGPGAPSYYLEDLQALASDTRQVILYDQLGCGRSDKPDNSALWRVEYFVEELGVVRKALGLDTVHLWGHSWGGMLAIEYMLTHPQGVISLTLASTPPSMPMWAAETKRLLATLPMETQAIIKRHEDAGTTDRKEYQEAVMAFYSQYVIRLSPLPESIQHTMEEIGQVYLTMNGPSEFCITGIIKDWNRIDRLHEIQVPTLITSGRYDEATPMMNEMTHKAIENSEWIVFENSAHMSHIEEKDLYLSSLASFIKRRERVL